MSKVYQVILSSILAMLDKGVVPWRKPWSVSGFYGAPGTAPMQITRGSCGKAYRGINVLLLWASGLAGPWFTIKQIRAMGGRVKDGEWNAGRVVTFWTLIDSKQEKDSKGKPRKIPLLRYYKVWSLCQCEGIAPANLPAWYRKRQAEADKASDEPDSTFTPIERAEQIWAEYRRKPNVVEGQMGAWYRPGDDRIGLPARDTFNSVPEFYSTLFHEAVHSTGHKDRLGRDLKPLFLDSHSYSKEELVAEIGAAFLCAAAGIEDKRTLENSAAYIEHWRKELTRDPALIVQAASAAQRACDHVLGVEFDREDRAE